MPWKKSKLFNQRNRRSVQNNQRQMRTLCAAAFEKLENRRVLAGYFSEIGTKLDSGIGNVQSALKTIQGVTELPFINKKITEINELTESLGKFRSDLVTKLKSDSLNNGAAQLAIQTEIFHVLGSQNGGLDILRDRNRDGAVNSDDVQVSLVDGVEVDLNIGFSTDDFTTGFSGKGIDSIPFKPQADTQGGFSVAVEYIGLNFGYSLATSTAFFQKSDGTLSLTLAGGLPGDKFSVGLGFLNLSAQDIHAGNDFSLTLESIVNSSGISAPTIGGEIHLHTHLLAEIDSEGMPQVQTDFILDWTIPKISPSTTMGAAWGAPTLSFKNIQVSLGSLVGGVAKPIAQHVKSIFEPLEPLFDLLEEPIPALNDLSTEFGGPTITLLSMVGAFPNGLPPDLVRMVRSAQTLRDYYQKVKTLASVSTGWLKLGDFNIAAPGGNFLSGRAPSALGSFALDAANKILPWSDLISPNGTPNLRGIEDQIRDLLGASLGNEVVDIFKGLTKQDSEDGLSIKFPVIENPAGVALGMLLGQDKDLVVVDGKLNFKFDKPSKIKIIPGFSIILGVIADFKAEATIGYDTRGFREAIKPFYTGGSFDFAKTVNGLWIGSNTRVDAFGSLIAGPEVGIEDVATLAITGEFALDLHAKISNPHSPPLEKIRPFAGDLGDRLFKVNGAFTAKASLDLKIGFDSPFGFVGFQKTWPLASATVFQFDTDSIGIPADLAMPPATNARLFEYYPADRLLTLNAGPNGPVRNVGTAVIDENFTVEHIVRYDIPAIYQFGILIRPALQTDIFVIRFGSLVEVFQGGFVDAVTADMGSGNDTLKIIDNASPIFYRLYGGTGNDVIDVKGHVDAQILGGEGNDKLDTGSGNPATNVPTTVHGGTGEDEIRFGDGLLSNVNPNEQYLVIREPDDRSLDRIIVDNKKSRLATSYYFDRNPVEGFAYQLEVHEGEDDIIRKIFMSQYDAVTIFGGSGIDKFSKAPPNYSRLYGGPGNDILSLYGADGLPLGEIIPFYGAPGFSFNGGDGDDLIVVDGDNRVVAPMLFELAASPTNPTSTRVGWTLMSGGVPTNFGFAVDLTGAEDTSLIANSASVIQVRGWNHHNLHLDGAAAVALSGTDSMRWNANVIIRNTPNITLFKFGSDELVSQARIDANGPYVDLGFGYRMSLDLDLIARSFVFDVDNAFLTLTPELIARNWNIQFLGSASSYVYIDVPNAGSPSGLAPDYTYRLESNRLVIGTMALGLSEVGHLTVNSGQGNDRFEAVAHPTWAQSMDTTFNGGYGIDSLFVDDRFNSLNAFWLIKPEQILLLSGGFLISNSGIEDMQVRGGYGDNLYSFWGDFKQPLQVDGGTGNDEFRIGQSVFPASFESPLQVNGGEGNDSFLWFGTNNANNGSEAGNIVHSVTIDGGTGANSLQIDDKQRFSSPTDYEIYPTRILTKQTGFGAWADFNYENMRTVSLAMGDNRNTVDVYGISSNVSNYFAILGNNNSDEVRVYPEDVEGGSNLNGSLVIDGGLGVDHVLVDASNSSREHQLTIETVIVASVQGFGTKSVSTDSDVERFELRTGNGEDTFSVESFTFPSMTLDISAGAGNDMLEIVPSSKSVYDSLSDAATFLFDGGEGTDSIKLDDSHNFNSTYTRDNNSLRAARTDNAFTLSMTQQNFELATLTGGTGANAFYIDALPSGETLSVNAHGLDSFHITHARDNAKEIRGQLILDGGAQPQGLFISDTANTTGSRFHIDSESVGTLGGAVGDSLFASGGSLHYRNLKDSLFNIGIALELGSGPDTIFAIPQVNNSLSINANQPTTTAGDRLFLDLREMANPSLSDFGDGSGQVFGGSRSPVYWSGFEHLDSTYVAPQSFRVTNTLDSGPGSFRQALFDANDASNEGGPSVIRFAIPGVGAHTIKPLSPLPVITNSVVIDGTTQFGYAGKPIIELDGSLAGNSHGLFLSSGGNTIRGLAINRFVGTPSSEIWIQGPGGNAIQGNYLGTNLAGNAVFPFALQGSHGVVVFGSDGNIIGTDGDGINDAYEGNVISGHNTAGILVQSGIEAPDNNVFAGNRIGTTADGNAVLGNGRMGLFFLSSGTGNRVGTNSDGISDTSERNIISGNPEAGIYLIGSGNVVAGNYIGTNAAGGGTLGNGDGIVVNASNNNRIGGSQPGAGNLIANSTYAGIILSGGSGTGNSILGNSFFNNARLGINLQSSNEPGIYYVTPNDASDTDGGVNNLQNFPEIATALTTSTQTVVGGKLRSTPRAEFRIEFFQSVAKDQSGYGEGQTYLGFVTATTDSTGVANFVANFPTLVPVGQFISSTATDLLGNTSEFSLSVAVVQSTTLSNVVPLQLPGSNTVFLVTSPVGSSLTAAIKSTVGVAPPNGFEFPYGFLDFTIRGISPGSAANLSISGLDVSQIRDYYKYGPTPGNRSAHWYSFMFGQRNPSDNPAGTGMELVGGTMILRLLDGKRGDDDLTANGVIAGIGGAVRNHAPVATVDFATLDEDSVLRIDKDTLMRNDRDVDGDRLVLTAVGQATNGTVTLAHGVVKFIPSPNFNGKAGFVYTLNDGYISVEGRVTIGVNEVNDAPIANPDTVNVAEDGTVDIDVRANDTKGPANESGQSLTVKRAEAHHGTVSINSNGTLRYRPAANYFGSDTITYVVEDNGKTNDRVKPLSARGTVAVTVTPINDAPIADDLNVWVNQDDKIRIRLAGTDVETQSDNLRITVTTLPVFGQLQTQSGEIVKVGDRYTGSTTLVYRPGAARDGFGADSFKYTVTDSRGAAGALTDEATVVLNIAKAVEDGRVTIDSSGVVRIGGTSGNDDIVASMAGSKLKIKLNGRVVSDDISLSRVRELRAWGRNGNDKIDLSSVDLPTLVHGGTGDDEIRGGARSNLIFAGEGNDRLFGGAGADLLIGGSGADSLTDSQGNDIMFGGNVSTQLTDDFFREVLQQWSGGRVQNSRFRQALTEDTAVDSFFDSQGDDWYLLGATDLSTDLYTRDRDIFDRVN